MRAEKAGHTADSVHSINNKGLYQNETEKQDKNQILNTDELLKEAVIKLFVDMFSVLASHPSQYCGTEVLQMRVDLIPDTVQIPSETLEP